MGDAIFCGFPIWSRADVVLIVWGDQVFVSQDTLRRTCSLHNGVLRTIVLPVVRLSQPVEYVFNEVGSLESVRQSREGDLCTPNGYNDIGAFALSVPGLRDAWTHYLTRMHRGAGTGEINFLPFLPYLASTGWSVKRFAVADSREARGINTPEDLEFFRRTSANETGAPEREVTRKDSA